MEDYISAAKKAWCLPGEKGTAKLDWGKGIQQNHICIMDWLDWMKGWGMRWRHKLLMAVKCEANELADN